ncbi:MAG: SIS domain-containing protein [Planctomycetota bacterium]|nr:MAG: SIS domain-containing protein [Planctomycetota bacterium]
MKTLQDLDQFTMRLKANQGLSLLLLQEDRQKQLSHWGNQLALYISRAEKDLSRQTLSTSRLEEGNRLLVYLKDLAWRIQEEILANLPKIQGLIHPDLEYDWEFCTEIIKINSILNNLDRLEIRGRDSAGFSCMVYFQSFEDREKYLSLVKEHGLWVYWEERIQRKDNIHQSIHFSLENPAITFVFKRAQEIGRLGENMEYLRGEIRKDLLFQVALAYKEKKTSYLAHTRWASNGIINIFNCHPVDNQMVSQKGKEWHYLIPPFEPSHPHYGSKSAYIHAVLNGDIDNYLSLKENLEKEMGYRISPAITTDAKIIPLEVHKYLMQGDRLDEAFRKAVSQFTGSSAIALYSDLEPDKIFLSLKGSGQSIYVGLGEDHYIFASEIYGLVEQASQYIKMDGEALAHPEDPEKHGQVFVLHRNGKDRLSGIQARYLTGESISLEEKDIKASEITTRDINRKGFDHFFLKEISESPQSVSKTLRGKYYFREEKVDFTLGEEILPASILEGLEKGKIKKIYVMGQGTAGVAALAVAAFLQKDLAEKDITVHGLSASEMSGFHLAPQMNDSLVIGVTQSGTTTDTNNAIELVKRRGAKTLAIVNRRNSDITFKVDGVFYTSDGRDVEMSVASTKAFYSQVVAGNLLSLALAKHLGVMDEKRLCKEVEELENLPWMMEEVLKLKETIAKAAKTHGPTRKHWATLGSGLNHIAAKEVRIKLSELCYKSIACDYVEDKKHIDLSSEPLILVCAAGCDKRVLGDIIKDVSIFKSHKSLPIVFASEEIESFSHYSQEVIPLPKASEKASLVLNTLAGHLFGYYTALAIHEEGLFLTRIRSLVVSSLSQRSTDDGFSHQGLDLETMQKLEEMENEFYVRKRQRRFESSLEVQTASDLSLLFKYATNKLPLIYFQRDFDIKPPTPQAVSQRLIESLNKGANELLRPIDAIKHQAKTVTVGTSRLELPEGPLFDLAERMGIHPDDLSPESIQYLKRIQPAIEKIEGYTLYAIVHLDRHGKPTSQTRIYVLQKGGIAEKMKSRLENAAPLMGNKRIVVQEGRPLLTEGSADNRNILILPILGDDYRIEKLLLYHIQFVSHLPLSLKISLLPNEVYEKIKNLVLEANQPWQDEYLEDFSPKELLLETPHEIAEVILQKLENKE